MILAIDFDGVIHDPYNRAPGYKMGRPIVGAAEAIRKLKDEGHTVIIHTLRGGDENRKSVADWMLYFKIPCDAITNIKPEADIYLDDKAVQFTTWNNFKL